MLAPALLNLLIPQGSDLRLPLALRHGISVRCPAAKSAGAATIKIHPAGISMAAGDRIMAGCDELELAAALTPDAIALSVTQIPTAIANDTTLVGPLIDLTGWSARGKIRDRSKALIADLSLAIPTPTNGEIILDLSSAVTAAIASNCDWQALDGLDLQLIGRANSVLVEAGLTPEEIARIEAIAESAYRWDFETVDNNGQVFRRVEGLAFVTSEETKP